MSLFDTHCHLAGEEFTHTLGDVLAATAQNRVSHVTIVATNLADGRRAREIAARAELPVKAYATLGLHPHEAKSFDKAFGETLEREIGDYVAVGETGLDYHYNHSAKDQQLESFIFHVDLSIHAKKPIVIHCREAVEDIYAVFFERKNQLGHVPGVMHCFSENWEWGKKFIDLGFYLSFSGILTFKAAETVRISAQNAPLDRIVIETDSPYLAPIPFRGKQNSPQYLHHTFEKLCEIRSESHDLIEDTIMENSKRLFALESA